MAILNKISKYVLPLTPVSTQAVVNGANTLVNKALTKTSTSTTKATTPTNDANTLADLLANEKGSSVNNYYSSGSGYTPVKADTTDIITALNEKYNTDVANATAARDRDLATLLNEKNQANEDYDTQLARLKSTYDTAASNLNKSLTRFQEQNKLDKEAQRQNYLNNQAALESARLEADRQNRINASARGLGGSGLQQLAQLQTLLNQGQEISDLAKSNQTEVNALNRALTQEEEDINDQLAQALNTYNTAAGDVETNRRRTNEAYNQSVLNRNNTLDELINSLTANRNTDKANILAQAEANYVNALNSARAQSAANSTTAKANNAAANSTMNTLIADLFNAQQQQERGNNEGINGLKKYYLGDSVNVDKVTNKDVLGAMARALSEKYGTDLSSYLKKYGSWFTG